LKTIATIEIENFETKNGSVKRKKQQRKTRRYDARLKILFSVSLRTLKIFSVD
jgi:hypothetical protein